MESQIAITLDGRILRSNSNSPITKDSKILRVQTLSINNTNSNSTIRTMGLKMDKGTKRNIPNRPSSNTSNRTKISILSSSINLKSS